MNAITHRADAERAALWSRADTMVLPRRFQALLDGLPRTPVPEWLPLLLGLRYRVSAVLPPNMVAFERDGAILALMRLDAEEPTVRAGAGSP
jgi:hypothetical protein